MRYLESNLEILGKRSPGLAEAVRNAQPSRRVLVKQSRAGQPGLWVFHEAGTLRPVYDVSDPRGAAQADVRGTAFRAEDATLFTGIGLGYHLEEITRLMEADHQVFVVEPNPRALKTALEARDLRALFLHERVHFHGDRGLLDLKETLRFHLLRIVGGHLNELVLSPLEEVFPEEYAEAGDRIRKILWHLRYSYRHLIDNDILRENLIRNIPALCRSGDAWDLEGILAGTPAVVIAAGPSLDACIDPLKTFSSKACLIAVDTALKPLMEQGIVPHFVVSVDPWEQNFEKFESLAETPDIPLIFEPGVYHRIPGFFPETPFVTGSTNSLARWILGLLGLGRMDAEMTSAAHLAFHLARHMGADPIILAGLDLAFPGTAHHARGAAACWEPGQEQEWIHVPCLRGGTVKTLPGFLAMIGLFEEELARTRALCINTGEAGALIRGARHMSLETAFRTLTAKKPSSLEAVRKIHSKSRAGDRAPWLLQGIRGLLAQAEQVASLETQATPLLSRAKQSLSAANGFDGKSSGSVERLLSMDRRLKAQSMFHDLTVDFHATLFLEQYRLGYRLKRASDPTKSLMLSLESLEKSFTGCGSVARKLAEDLRGILPELEKAVRRNTPAPADMEVKPPVTGP